MLFSLVSADELEFNLLLLLGAQFIQLIRPANFIST